MRTIIHSELFTRQCEEICSIDIMDEVLIGITWAISNNPEEYPIILGTNKLRIIKTRTAQWGDKTIPALRIYFVIHDLDSVELLFVELLAEEE